MAQISLKLSKGEFQDLTLMRIRDKTCNWNTKCSHHPHTVYYKI